MNDDLDMSRYPSAQELRKWAEGRKPGAVGLRGNLPRFLILAWNRTHPDRPYVPSQGFHGTTSGYQQMGCRCLQCGDFGRARQRELYRQARDDRDEEAAWELTDSGGAS